MKEKSLAVLAKMQRAVKTGNLAELDEIPWSELRMATFDLAREKGTPAYELLTDVVKRREEREESTLQCGLLAKEKCDMEENIKANYNEGNVFLDIPYSNYEDCEQELREILKSIPITPIVAKDKPKSFEMLCKICQMIKSCKYGIADISSGSNNVSYELGLMHAFGLKVALLLRKKADKHSDLSGLEHISYNGLRTFKIRLLKWISENVEQAKKEELAPIIEVEEALLKKEGEIGLRNLWPVDEKNNDEIIANHMLGLEKIKLESKLHKSSPDISTYVFYALPLSTKDQLIKISDLVSGKDNLGYPGKSYPDIKFNSKSLYLLKPHGRPELGKDPLTSEYEYFVANISGLVFYEMQRPQKQGFPKRHVIGYNLLGHIYLFVWWLLKFYTLANYEGRVRVGLGLMNAKDSRFISLDEVGHDIDVGHFGPTEEIDLPIDVEKQQLLQIEDVVRELYMTIRAEANVPEAFNQKIVNMHLGLVKKNIY